MALLLAPRVGSRPTAHCSMTEQLKEDNPHTYVENSFLHISRRPRRTSTLRRGCSDSVRSAALPAQRVMISAECYTGQPSVVFRATPVDCRGDGELHHSGLTELRMWEA